MKICVGLGSISIIFYDNIIFLEQADGEGMEVSMQELEKLLQEYYSGNF
jgi:hypothetical protein